MPTTFMQTIERRQRVSDGTDVCDDCDRTLAKGEVYTWHNLAGPGLTIGRNICADCQGKPYCGEDTASWLIVIAASVCVIALTAWALVG